MTEIDCFYSAIIIRPTEEFIRHVDVNFILHQQHVLVEIINPVFIKEMVMV